MAFLLVPRTEHRTETRATPHDEHAQAPRAVLADLVDPARARPQALRRAVVGQQAGDGDIERCDPAS
jgi:hypothetical protein